MKKTGMRIVRNLSLVAVAGFSTYTLFHHDSFATTLNSMAEELSGGGQWLQWLAGGTQADSATQTLRQKNGSSSTGDESRQQSSNQGQGLSWQSSPTQDSVSNQQQNQSQPQVQSTAADSTVTLAANAQASENWAGYIDTPSSSSTKYTSISGNWTVPSISGSSNSMAAQWIGLGGSSSQKLLQVGTTEEFENGKAVAGVFWEKLPGTAKTVMTIPTGSTFHAKISKVSSTTWDITFSARTPSGKSLTKTVPVTVSGSYAQGIETSGEWISEDPSGVNNTLYPLANAGTVDFTNATVNGTALASSSNQVTPIALEDDYGDVLVAPSSVESNGESFSTITESTGENTTTDEGSSRWNGGSGQVEIPGEGGWQSHRAGRPGDGAMSGNGGYGLYGGGGNGNAFYNRSGNGGYSHFR